MEKIRVLFNEKELSKREDELAKELYKVYGDEPVIFVITLKGATLFACDLMKKYPGDARLEFIRVSSYSGDSSTGIVNLKLPLNEDRIKGQNVVIIEDIVDTGNTLKYLREYVNSLGAKSVRECTLLDKKARRTVEIEPTYSGFVIDDLFVIGYGLDYDEKYRNLPYIGVVEKD